MGAGETGLEYLEKRMRKCVWAECGNLKAKGFPLRRRSQNKKMANAMTCQKERKWQNLTWRKCPYEYQQLKCCIDLQELQWSTRGTTMCHVSCNGSHVMSSHTYTSFEEWKPYCVKSSLMTHVTHMTHKSPEWVKRIIVRPILPYISSSKM